MIRHIVLFKMKAFENEAARQQKLTEIKTGLEALSAHIPQIKLIKAGINMNPEELWMRRRLRGPLCRSP